MWRTVIRAAVSGDEDDGTCDAEKTKRTTVNVLRIECFCRYPFRSSLRVGPSSIRFRTQSCTTFGCRCWRPRWSSRSVRWQPANCRHSTNRYSSKRRFKVSSWWLFNVCNAGMITKSICTNWTIRNVPRVREVKWLIDYSSFFLLLERISRRYCFENILCLPVSETPRFIRSKIRVLLPYQTVKYENKQHTPKVHRVQEERDFPFILHYSIINFNVFFFLFI